MVNLMWYLRVRICTLLDLDERVIETLEWHLIGAIVTGVAAGTYTLLSGGLDQAITETTDYIVGQVP